MYCCDLPLKTKFQAVNSKEIGGNNWEPWKRYSNGLISDKTLLRQRKKH